MGGLLRTSSTTGADTGIGTDMSACDEGVAGDESWPLRHIWTLDLALLLLLLLLLCLVCIEPDQHVLADGLGCQHLQLLRAKACSTPNTHVGVLALAIPGEVTATYRSTRSSSMHNHHPTFVLQCS